MTDQKRDESRDIGVCVSRGPDDNIEMDCADWKRVNPLTYGVRHYERFVPHADLVAAEERIKKLEAAMVDAMDQVHRNPVDAICTLRKGLK